MSIYVSTGTFNIGDINRILEIAYNNNIKNIELAPGLDYNPDTVEIVLRAKNDFNFLIHNYFPTPKTPFALNLATDDQIINQKSIDMCKSAIDLCYELKIPYYSVHCGFCFNSDGRDLGNSSQTKLKRIPKDIALGNFVENIQKLCEYANSKCVGIAIENNVLAGFAKGEDNILLGVCASDIIEIIQLVNKKNLNFLIDLAHAKVSSYSCSFEMDSFISDTIEYAKEVHVSQNNGYKDENKKIELNDDIFNWITNYKGKTITLEAYNLSVSEIKEQIKIINSALNRR